MNIKGLLRKLFHKEKVVDIVKKDLTTKNMRYWHYMRRESQIEERNKKNLEYKERFS